MRVYLSDLIQNPEDVTHLDLQKIKSLNDPEKKILFQILQAIKLHQSYIDVDNLGHYKALKRKVTEKTVLLNSKSTGPEKVIKSIHNLFNSRVPSAVLQREIRALEKLISGYYKELENINQEIMELSKEKEEIQELIDYKQTFLLQIYEEMFRFYEKLPTNQLAAKPIIQQKIEEIRQRTERLKIKEPQLNQKKAILRMEILRNLAQMEAYSGNQFEIELEANKMTWKNTLEFTKDEEEENRIYNEIKTKLKSLNQRKELLENLLFGNCKTNPYHKTKAIGFASPEIADNKEIVLAAVSKDGLKLEFASERLKNDWDVVSAALKQTRKSQEFIGKELESDNRIYRIF